MAVLKDLIVHGRSRFLNGAQFNTINAESIGANEGIFNKLIATTLDAKEATIEDLTATNAVVTGLLDVQGQMQTNSWTNSNIATIDGSFYICPTISSEAIVTTSGTTQTSNNKFLYNGSTVILTGTWATANSLYLDNSAADWNLYSKVMITGEVLIGTEWTPIGTIRGVLTGINTSSGTITIGSLSSNITVGTDGTINSLPAILSLVTSGTTYNARKLKISLYEYNSTGVSSNETNLIGIMMTTAGTHGFTYLDIYNGLNSKTSYTSTLDNTTKATEPMVRIGNLNGLPNIVNGSSAEETKPKGWGIYTTNGFFKGKIVANAGRIGDWTINNPGYGGAISNGTFGASGGVFITPSYTNSAISIGGSSGSKNWTITAGSTFGITKEGELYATNGKIANWTIATNNLSTGTIGSTNGILISTNNTTNYTINGSSRSNLRLVIGTKFGVDNDGTLYANGANITNINGVNITAGTITVGKLETSVQNNLDTVKELDKETFGTITYEYNNNGTIETVYYNSEDGYYYYLDDTTERQVSYSDLLTEDDEVIINRQLDGLNTKTSEIYTNLDTINAGLNENNVDIVDLKEAIQVNINNSLVAQNYATIGSNGLIIYGENTQGDLVSRLELTSTSIELKTQDISVASISSDENSQGIMTATNMKQTFITMQDSSENEYYRWIAQSNGHLSLKKI